MNEPIELEKIQFKKRTVLGGVATDAKDNTLSAAHPTATNKKLRLWWIPGRGAVVRWEDYGVEQTRLVPDGALELYWPKEPSAFLNLLKRGPGRPPKVQ